MELLGGAYGQVDRCDGVLKNHCHHWDLGRLALVDRGILRLAVHELLSGQTPAKVVITEALKLAREFSTAESPRFVNGVLDSGFLPLGPNGETYLRMELGGGGETGPPPNGPTDWHLELRAGGVVRVVGVYYQADAWRATEWALAYTTDGSTPATDNPDVTVNMPVHGLAALANDLPAASHGATVKARLQTRRNDGGGWLYSENSVVLQLTADAQGPAAPQAGERWAGHLPEGDS